MIPRSESRAFTVYTTTYLSNRTLDHDTQVVFTIMPPPENGVQPSFAPIAWKVFSFEAKKDAEKTAVVTYRHRIASAEVVGDRVWNVDVNSAGVGKADQYIAFTNEKRWGSYRLMGGSESIVAINQSETEQTFTVGTMALKQGFEPLLLLGSVRRRPGDAVTFKPPSYLQAFASSGCEVENVALVGQILPPTSEQLLEPIPLSELEPHAYWHLYSGTNGLALERKAWQAIASNPVQLPPASSLHIDTPYLDPLSTPPSQFCALPLDLILPGEFEDHDPYFGPPLFTPPPTPYPDLLYSPSQFDFLTLNESPSDSPFSSAGSELTRD